MPSFHTTRYSFSISLRHSANMLSTNHPNSHLTDCGADSSIDFGNEGIDVSPIPGSYLEQVLGLHVRNQPSPRVPLTANTYMMLNNSLCNASVHCHGAEACVYSDILYYFYPHFLDSPRQRLLTEMRWLKSQERSGNNAAGRAKATRCCCWHTCWSTTRRTLCKCVLCTHYFQNILDK